MKIYLLIRFLVLGGFAAAFVPFTILQATGSYSLGTDPSFSGFLIYIDLGVALLLFLPEFLFFLCKREKYLNLFTGFYVKGTTEERIYQASLFLLSVAGFVFLIASLLGSPSLDMVLLAVYLLLYAAIGLVYPLFDRTR